MSDITTEKLIRWLRSQAEHIIPGHTSQMLAATADRLEQQEQRIVELNDFQNSQCAKLIARNSELERKLAAAHCTDKGVICYCDTLLELRKQLAAAKEDIAVGWTCYCCAHREKGREWAFCPEREPFIGTEDKVAMCKNFVWRGAREGEGKCIQPNE